MGTSGSYGGSKKQVWQTARQEVLKLPGGSDGGDGQSPPSPADDLLQELWGAIADAFDSDDPTLHQTLNPGDLALPQIMPWLKASGGSGSGGGSAGSGGARTGGGRQGTGSRRQVTRSAARGGTVLGAGYALRAGDATYLAELGLDLNRLQTLSPVRQCAEILDAVLGEGSHPDEHALRKASLEALKEVLIAPQPPAEGAALKAFVVNFVFELSLVELQRQVNEGTLTGTDVAKKEKMVRTYLDKRVQAITTPSGTIQPSDLRQRAADLTKEVIKILRARGGGSS